MRTVEDGLAALRAGEELGSAVLDTGLAYAPAFEHRDLAALAHRVAATSVAVYGALLDLEG